MSILMLIAAGPAGAAREAGGMITLQNDVVKLVVDPSHGEASSALSINHWQGCDSLR